MGPGSFPSETCAFEVVGAEWVRDLEPGEIVIIDDEGVTYDSYTTDTPAGYLLNGICLFRSAGQQSFTGSMSMQPATDGPQTSSGNSNMRQISLSACLILPCQRPLAFPKSLACQMKWV